MDGYSSFIPSSCATITRISYAHHVAQRNFALLRVAGLVCFVGDWMQIGALPAHIYEQSGSSLSVGVLWLNSLHSRRLIGSAVEGFLDCWDRDHTMVTGTKLGMAAGMEVRRTWPSRWAARHRLSGQ